MENRKIRVGITQGDANGVGFEMIFKTFAEPDMLELCTPVIYGSGRMASFHSKTLGIQCHLNIINKVEDAEEGKVNLLQCVDDNIRVDFGQPEADKEAVAIKAIKQALADGGNGFIDVMVCAPSKSGFKNNVQIYQDNWMRFVALGNAESADNLVSLIKNFRLAMRRDFLLTNPRIALMESCVAETDIENEALLATVKSLAEEGVQVYGPYKAEQFICNREYEAFDGVIVKTVDEGLAMMNSLSESVQVVIETGLPVICTRPNCDAQLDIAGKNMADESMLRNAIYTAIDIFRSRNEYEKARVNPLPKLYKERPDSGEKLRFSIPKKKEE